MRFRAAAAAVAVAIMATLLGPVAPAHAAKPRLTYLFTSASSGIVAGNAIWGQKSIQWTGYVAGRPKGSRLVTQTKVSGAWRTIATTDKSVRRTVARGRFFPVLGSHRYRIALLSKKGKVLVASKAWTSTGYATVPLARVLDTLPPTPGATPVAIGGYTYPMQWRYDTTFTELPYTGPSYRVDAARCPKLRLAASLTYPEGTGTTAHVQIVAAYKPTPLITDMGSSALKLDDAGGTTTGTAPLSGVGVYSFKVHAWATDVFGGQAAWAGGTAQAGGVGLCSKVVR